MSRIVNNLAAAFALDLTTAMTAAVEQVAGQAGGLAAAITYIGQEPDVGVDRLGTILGVSQPAAVRLVNQLSADGLVTRTRHETDARRVQLRLTEAGRRRAGEIATARLAAAGAFLDPLSTADRRELFALIGRIYAKRAPSMLEAEQICRLCNVTACPERSCPIDAATC